MVTEDHWLENHFLHPETSALVSAFLLVLLTAFQLQFLRFRNLSDSFPVAYPVEKEMSTHPSIPAWIIPWTEEAGRLQSMGSQRVGHD